MENFRTRIVFCDSMVIMKNDIIKTENFACLIKSSGENRMNTAASEIIPDNPIDVVEQILSRHAYEPERRSQNEVVTEIQGRWNDMLLFFSWEENMHCLHLSCLINIEDRQPDHNKIFELLALINDDLWVGHFSYWTEQKMPVFRYSLFYNPNNRDFPAQLANAMDIAIRECERLYPIFNVVMTKGLEPKQALYPLLLDTLGQA